MVKPNIDEGAATISQSGLYILRTAGLRMQRKASQALTAKVGDKTLNFYNESLAEDGSLRTEAEGLFDKNYDSIIGAPILWAGRLIEGKLEIFHRVGVVNAFELRLRTTVGFGRIPVGSKTYKCR